jgi:hypothetical protein
MISHTKQEWFDLAVRGLAGQRWKCSVNDFGACAYGRQGGPRCAIGHGIGSLNVLEGLSASDLARSGHIAVNGLLDASGADFLLDLQCAHDNSRGERDMRSRFVNLAERHSLTWPADVPKEGAIQ